MLIWVHTPYIIEGINQRFRGTSCFQSHILSSENVFFFKFCLLCFLHMVVWSIITYIRADTNMFFFPGYGWMVGAATSSTHTSALPSLLLESIVTSTKISVMPSVSSQNNSTTNSPAASSPSGYTNISSAGQSTTLRFDRHVVPNYSSNFMSSSLTSPSCKSSTVVGRQIGDIPALPLQLFNCEQCGRSYACEYTLRRHIRLECGKEATLQCPLCPRRTKHKHSLLRHINKFHPGTHI